VQGLDAVMFTLTTDTRDINGDIVYVHPLLGGAIGKGLLGIKLGPLMRDNPEGLLVAYIKGH
jgi:hypothetical protein